MKHLYSYKQYLNEEVEPQVQQEAKPEVEPTAQPTIEPTVQPMEEINIEQTGKTEVKTPAPSKFAQMIDYTNLKPGATKEDINRLIKEAMDNKFYAVVVPYEMVDHAAYTIDDGDLKVVSVLDYPEGDSNESDKLFEATELISNGADEIDMVMDYKALKGAYEEEDGEFQESSYTKIEREIKTISDECHKNGVILKVIIESGELTLEQVVKACEMVGNAGADYVMTSTGTKRIGAELEKVKEMRRILPEWVKIKVAGGIRSLADCEKYYQYVDRIGTSVIPK